MKKAVKKITVMAMAVIMLAALSACTDNTASGSSASNGMSGQEQTIIQADTGTTQLDELSSAEGNDPKAESETEPYFDLVVEGKTYDFPLSFDEFVSCGWKPTDTAYTMDDLGALMILAKASDQMMPEPEMVYVSSGNISGAVLRVTNLSDTEQAVKDCLVTGLDFSKGRNLDFTVFPAGSVKLVSEIGTITIGETTKDEINAMLDAWILMSVTFMTEEQNISFQYDDNDILEGFNYRSDRGLHE